MSAALHSMIAPVLLQIAADTVRGQSNPTIFAETDRQTDGRTARLTPQNHAIISSGCRTAPVTSAPAAITTLPLPLHNRHNFTQAKETKWESNHQGVTFTEK